MCPAGRLLPSHRCSGRAQELTARLRAGKRPYHAA